MEKQKHERKRDREREKEEGILKGRKVVEENEGKMKCQVYGMEYPSFYFARGYVVPVLIFIPGRYTSTEFRRYIKPFHRSSQCHYHCGGVYVRS